MIPKFSEYLRRFRPRRDNRSDQSAPLTYSQLGEDRLIRMAGNLLGIGKLNYLDIGCYDPLKLSNTYLFYLEGAKGVCVDPNGSRLDLFRSERPNDVLVEAGVTSLATGSATYFVLDEDYLNTFSKDEADRLQKDEGHRLIATKTLPVINISELTRNYFPSGDLHLVSLDVEGMDLDLLQAFNFDAQRPPIWCVETVEYRRNGSGSKTTQIAEFMSSKNYFAFADTYVNTIFVDQSFWDSKQIDREDAS